MNLSRSIRVLLLCIVALTMVPLYVQAEVINFSGQLDFFEIDAGGAVYSGVPLGTTFTGNIDDINFDGIISDGSTPTSFDCCGRGAGGLSITNDMILTQDDADFLNSLLGSPIYNPGSSIDLVDIEGDADTSSGGRIEVGLSYIFDSSTFADELPNSYYSNQINPELALFFIFEENSIGDEIYSAGGQLDPVPLPAAAWLLGSGLIGLAALRKKTR